MGVSFHPILRLSLLALGIVFIFGINSSNANDIQSSPDFTESTIARPTATTTPRRAVTTLLYGNHQNYTNWLRVMHRSWQETQSKAEFFVMVTPDVNEHVRSALRGDGIALRDVEAIELPHYIHTFKVWNGVMTKLRAWTMIEYDQILLIDSDILFIPPQAFNSSFNPDAMFDLCGPEYDMCGVDDPSFVVNAGVIVLRPSLKSLDLLLSTIALLPATAILPEQELLDIYIRLPQINYKRLSRDFNTCGREWQIAYSNGARMIHPCGTVKHDWFPLCDPNEPVEQRSRYCNDVTILLYQNYYRELNPCAEHDENSCSTHPGCGWCSSFCTATPDICEVNDVLLRNDMAETDALARLQELKDRARLVAISEGRDVMELVEENRDVEPLWMLQASGGSPCSAGFYWSTDGLTPCTVCSTCAGGVQTACKANANTVCQPACIAGTSFSSNGYAPCTTCTACGKVKTACNTKADATCESLCGSSQYSSDGYTPNCLACATCSGPVQTACTATANTVCAAPCTSGSTWSATGYAQCSACTVCSPAPTATACTTTANTVCQTVCQSGSTWSSNGYTPCTPCQSCSTQGVLTACSTNSNTVCQPPCTSGTSWSSNGYAPCVGCSTCSTTVTAACSPTSNTQCAASCVLGSTWSSSGYAPCNPCTTTCTSVQTACSLKADTVCTPPCTLGTSWSPNGVAPCAACTTCAGAISACTLKSDTVCPNGCLGGKNFSVSGYAPCTTCRTCPVYSAVCTVTSNAVCSAACVAGKNYSTTGYEPCTACSSCGGGVQTTCTPTANTGCQPLCSLGSTYSASSYAPCTACKSCAPAPEQTACTLTANTVCQPPCVAGSTWSSTGYAPCATCVTCPVKSANCLAASNTVCAANCQPGVTWSSTGYAPCSACTVCPGPVVSACTNNANTQCAAPCAVGQWSATGYYPCQPCSFCVQTTRVCNTTADAVCNDYCSGNPASQTRHAITLTGSPQCSNNVSVPAGSTCTLVCDPGYQARAGTFFICSSQLGGWISSLNIPSCDDINECAISHGGCPVNTTCTNSDGAYQCSCGTGLYFNSDSSGCLDINACLSAPCGQNATCTDLPPPSLTRVCSCESGLDGDPLVKCGVGFAAANASALPSYATPVIGGLAGIACLFSILAVFLFRRRRQKRAKLTLQRLKVNDNIELEAASGTASTKDSNGLTSQSDNMISYTGDESAQAVLDSFMKRVTQQELDDYFNVLHNMPDRAAALDVMDRYMNPLRFNAAMTPIQFELFCQGDNLQRWVYPLLFKSSHGGNSSSLASISSSQMTAIIEHAMLLIVDVHFQQFKTVAPKTVSGPITSNGTLSSSHIYTVNSGLERTMLWLKTSEEWVWGEEAITFARLILHTYCTKIFTKWDPRDNAGSVSWANLFEFSKVLGIFTLVSPPADSVEGKQEMERAALHVDAGSCFPDAKLNSEALHMFERAEKQFMSVCVEPIEKAQKDLLTRLRAEVEYLQAFEQFSTDATKYLTTWDQVDAKAGEVNVSDAQTLETATQMSREKLAVAISTRWWGKTTKSLNLKKKDAADLLETSMALVQDLKRQRRAGRKLGAIADFAQDRLAAKSAVNPVTLGLHRAGSQRGELNSTGGGGGEGEDTSSAGGTYVGGSTSPTSSSSPDFVQGEDLTARELQELQTYFSEQNLLGKGAFGKVYRAEFRGEPVAVKVLTVDHNNRKVAEAFEKELRIHMHLRSPRLCNYIRVHRKAPYVMVMELLDRGNLRQLLSSTPLDERQRVQIAIQITRGLMFLHCNDPPIAHRDIKAENVLCDSNFQCKLADFGLSVIFDKNKDSSHVAGSALYMAPELFLSKSLHTDELLRADIYSLGILLIEIFTSRKAPWAGKTFQQIADMHTTNVSRSAPTDLQPDGIIPLINGCMDVHPASRPSVKTILAELTRVAGKNETQCDECEATAATVRCDVCNQNLCSPCSATLHKAGKRASHDIRALVATPTLKRSATSASKSPTRDRPESKAVGASSMNNKRSASPSSASSGGNGGAAPPPPPPVRANTATPRSRSPGSDDEGVDVEAGMGKGAKPPKGKQPAPPPRSPSRGRVATETD